MTTERLRLGFHAFPAPAIWIPADSTGHNNSSRGVHEGRALRMRAETSRAKRGLHGVNVRSRRLPQRNRSPSPLDGHFAHLSSEAIRAGPTNETSASNIVGTVPTAAHQIRTEAQLAYGLPASATFLCDVHRALRLVDTHCFRAQQIKPLRSLKTSGVHELIIPSETP